MDKETAMKILKELYNNSLSAERTALKTIIPELEESEDERIRKEMILYFTEEIPQCSIQEHADKMKEFIARLEKQGDDIKKIKELEDKIESLQKCFKIANDEIADKSQELYALKCKIEDEGCQWDEENLELSKIKQKPINKIKPKFKIGDWVVNNKDGTVSQITNILRYWDNSYGYEHTNGCFHGAFEKDYHLWTIADAKDGDVLVNQNGAMPFIFKECKNNHIYCYCGYTNRKDMFFDSFINSEGEELYWLNLYYEQVYPAKRDQRDLLFRKMKEAGYEWDSEKKELKKISQEYPLIPDECIKPTWSGEDERIYQSIMDDTVQENQLNGKQIDWLRDIKYRIFAQPKNTWKPTEKQLISLSCAIAALDAEDDDLASLYEILKKL